jgi:hypothetical protein
VNAGFSLPASGAVLLLTALGLAGCGARAPSYPTVKLEGTVRIGGQPVAEGFIMFISGGAHDQAPPTRAPIVQGRYCADQVPLGQVRVLFSACRATGRMIKEYSEPRPELENLVPEKYRDGIPLDIRGDNPQQDFDLK